MTTPPPPSASSEPSPNASRDKAAELMAAVRAVESGERSADEFFTEPRRPPARRGPDRPAGLSFSAASPAAPVPDELHEVLARGGAPASLAPAVADALGPRAAELLPSDPWQLLTVPGVGPEQADAFARALLPDPGGPDDPRRTQALVVWLSTWGAKRGHTVLRADFLAQRLAAHAVREPEEALRQAVDDGLLLDFTEEREDGGGIFESPGEQPEPSEEAPAAPPLLGLERWAAAEEGLAEGIQRLLSTFDLASGDALGGPEAWERAASSAPTASAAELIKASGAHAVVLHTGGEAAKAEPTALTRAASELGLRVCLCAYAEDGAERLASMLGSLPRSSTEREAEGVPEPYVVTVAGVLAGAEVVERDAEGCLAVDLLIVTEANQLDTEAAAALVESLPDASRLVLSGDPQTLGSSGAGQVLADLLAAGVCPGVASRTPDPGPLGELVSGVGVGELPRTPAPDRELVIVPVRDAGEAVHRTVQLVADSVPRVMGVPASDTQVITVGLGGGAGGQALNAALKQRLNPGPGAFGGFDAGDRVWYAPQAGGGLPGVVQGADDSGLQLSCAGRPVTVPRESVAETVRHGWAVTAHQAAGRRWPAVVVVLPGDTGQMLDRRWVYTAFGRGERHVSVVHGLGPELDRAVAERPGTPRLTRLRTLLSPPPAEPGEG